MKPVCQMAARRSILGRPRSSEPAAGRFTRADVSGLLERTWSLFAESVTQLPPQPTAGSRLNIRLAALTLAFFEALRHRGVERAYAVSLTADVTWQIYAMWGFVARALGRRGVIKFPSGLAAGDVVPLLFPFNPPGYVALWVPIQTGVAYDVVRCPVQSYFVAQGAADVCLSAWCNLDYALGQRLGLSLTREKLLVLGDDRCSFQWRATDGRAEAAR